MAMIMLAIRLDSKGPVFYTQTRVGKAGRIFKVVKFRTMRQDAEAASGPKWAGDNDPRVTRVGKFLRSSRLDEIPQLWCVLKGEMAFVGPRPERPEFVELFETDIRRYGDRHRVKSGVTGWAQVHGLRGQTSLSDCVEWDNYYIEHWTLGLDVKILALTMLEVLRPAE